MLLGLISDIHGRLDALQAAWNMLAPIVDRVVCLGDVVDGGGQDQECVTFLRENGIVTVRGNHDELWTELAGNSLRETANWRWMADLPVTLETTDLLLVHDDPMLLLGGLALPDAPSRISTLEQAQRVLEHALVFAGGDSRIAAIGHSHRPFAFSPDGELELRPGLPVLLSRASHWLINPGTVGGTPRSGWGYSCASFDTESRQFTVYPLRLSRPRTPWDDFFARMP